MRLDAEPDWENIRNGYGDYVQMLTDQNMISRISGDTPEIQQTNAERGRILSLIFYVNSNGLTSTKSDVKDAAILVDSMIRPYKGIQNEAYLRQTALIRGMLVDLHKPELTTAVAKLGLTTLLTDLEDINDAFDELSNKKSDKLAESSTLLSTKELRTRIDKTYQDICDLIFAIAILGDPESDDYQDAVDLIKSFNGIIQAHKTTHNMSMGQKKRYSNVTSEENDANVDAENI